MSIGFVYDLFVIAVGIFVAALSIDSQIDGLSGGAVVIFALLVFLNVSYAALFKQRGKMKWLGFAFGVQLFFGYLVAVRFL
ncbi:hypothetical protein C4564_01530 [Candidatus Microgenomates bacterium]|nr:MAG: hypothetical protein C4564_01530 [Candidatus Microgenomates bacterium]